MTKGRKFESINWNISPADFKLVNKIVDRLMEFKGVAFAYAPTDATMDLTATHLNGCPLDLDRLLAAPDDTFIHDLFGIRRHISRSTGKLENCFVPRCAKPEVTP